MKVRNVLCLTTVFVLAGAMAVQAAQEGDLCQLLQQGTVKESFLPNLSDKDLGRLAQTCKPMKAALDQELERRQEQKAIWLERVSNAGEVDCTNRRRMFDNEALFKDFVIRKIVTFNKENQGRWIRLSLRDNGLGGDIEFLKNLIDAIVTQVKALNIDITELNLANNGLTTLPGDIFSGLTNLQKLWLHSNQLQPKTNRELGLDDNVMVYWKRDSTPMHALDPLAIFLD